MIEVEKLVKTFPARQGRPPVQAIAEVSLSINHGEFITILGPSGCGKTTLLRAIAGLISWQSGTIRIDGEAVTGPGPERSMVFQSFALMPWASVLRNVAFGLEVRHVGEKERHARAHELIEMVGLEGFEHSHPGELSGGMQQRVGLARALAVDPKVLLMDEPFGALDEQTRRLLQEELLQIIEKANKTVVFVTHSMEEAVLLADRVVLMSARPGRIEKIIDVPLPRPRANIVDDVEASEEFVGVTRDLWRRLREMHRPQQGKEKAAS